MWYEGVDRAKFHPSRCNDKRIGPAKLTILLKFYQISEYKRPAGAYPLRDFHEICRICTSFQDALAVKIWMDLLKGLQSYEGFKLRGSGFPQIFSAPSGETVRHAPQVFEVEERARGPLSPCHIWWGSDFTRRQGGQKR